MGEHELQRVEVLSRVLDARCARPRLRLCWRSAPGRFKGSFGATVKMAPVRSDTGCVDGPRTTASELCLVRETYADFGPTLASEKLAERHGIRVSSDSLRQWMLAAGLWHSRAQRRQVHQPRLRREALGELIQIDGSDHRWFEDRGPACTLLVFVDDATGKLMQMRFVKSESTFTYFEALDGYLKDHGRPVAFYSDKHSIFRVAKAEVKSGHGMTQFGRALSELNIEILCANSSQAKGRIERANRTLQDRLVKGLRLAGISDMEAANRFLPGFIAQHDDRFARTPARPDNMHRPVNHAASRLKDGAGGMSGWSARILLSITTASG